MKGLARHSMPRKRADSSNVNIQTCDAMWIGRSTAFLCSRSPKRDGRLCDLPLVRKPIDLARLGRLENGTGKPWLRHGRAGLQVSRLRTDIMDTSAGIPGCDSEITRPVHW